MCIVAVSQSGTTTDTNRAVDMARGRGAAVLASSTGATATWRTRATACCTPSDGRDVEMSVASTKAFYSQVAAGCLLGLSWPGSCGRLAPSRRTRCCTR